MRNLLVSHNRGGGGGGDGEEEEEEDLRYHSTPTLWNAPPQSQWNPFDDDDDDHGDDPGMSIEKSHHASINIEPEPGRSEEGEEARKQKKTSWRRNRLVWSSFRSEKGRRNEHDDDNGDNDDDDDDRKNRAAESSASARACEWVTTDASAIQALFQPLNETIARVTDAYEQLPFEPTSAGAAALRRRMADDVAGASASAATLKSRIDKLKRDAGSLAPESAAARQAATFVGSFQRRLAAFLTQLGTLKKLAREREAKILERRAYAAFGERLASGEAETLLDDAGADGGAAAELVLRQAVRDAPKGSASENGQRTAAALAQIRGARVDADARLGEALALEASLNDLYALFLDMATLVDAQGEQLNSVAVHVASSVAYTHSANVELARAKHLQKSVLRKRCAFSWICVAIVGVVVAIVVVLVMGVSVGLS